MTNHEAFSSALGALALNARLGLAPEQLTLFWRGLGDLTDEEFQGACNRWLQSPRGRFFPAIGELRELARPYTSMAAEAGAAFEAVCKMGRWRPTGYVWDGGKVAEAYGPVAAAAFYAAGASRAFADEQDPRNLPFLRKRFLEAYAEAEEARRAGREVLPPAAVRPALASSPVGQLTAGVVNALSGGAR